MSLVFALTGQYRHNDGNFIDVETPARARRYLVALLIPMMIAAVSGAVIATAFNQPWYIVLAVSFGITLLVGMFDHVLLSEAARTYHGGGSFKSAIARSVVSLLMALVCSAFVDMYVFEADIHKQKQEHVIKDLHAQITQVRETDIPAKQAELAHYEQEYKSELDHPRRPGPGVIAKSWLADRDRARSELLQLEAKVVDLQQVIEQTALGRRPEIYEHMGFFERVQLFHEFLDKHAYGFLLWLVITTIIVFLDLQVVITKAGHTLTMDDRAYLAKRDPAKLREVESRIYKAQ